MAGKSIINILMADDDEDDRYFFAKALKALSIPTKLLTVQDGEQLIDHLNGNKGISTDILFLDINMPRKNGYECLLEIKGDAGIKNFPVIMYSTSLRDSMADKLYQNGADYYLQKGNFKELVKHLQVILAMVEEKKLQRPSREGFVLNEAKVI